MKALKVIGKILLGLVGLVVLLYFIGVAINWRDQPPSAAALEMKKIIDDRAPVADADNGYVFLLGFSAAEAEDPVAVGSARKTWLEAVNFDRKKLRADPMKERVEFNAAISKSMLRIRNECGETNFVACRDAFVAALPEQRLGLEALQLTRYRALIEKPAWREVVPVEISAPLPAYADIVQGQRLHFVDLAARAKSVPPEEIASAFRKDLAFWRTTMVSADILITKMIAIAAIRQHFHFGNLVLRDAPAVQNEVIEVWSVPFSPRDLSIRQTMAGEWAYSEGILRAYQRGDEGNWIEPSDEGLTLPGRMGSSLARPYYRHQDQMNYYAAEYLDIAERFEVPLDQYARVVESIRAKEPAGDSFHVYNAVGHVLRGLSDSSVFAGYPPRVGSVEGMRRAALLTAQLRARGIPMEKVAAELRTTELNDPFKLEPFEWDAADKAVVYMGPRAERDRAAHHYLY